MTVYFQILFTDEAFFSLVDPKSFSVTDQLPFANPPRSRLSKTGRRNFFAVSPVVEQMHGRLPHTWLKGWQITLQQRWSVGNVECFISSFRGLVCAFNVYSVQLSTRLLSHQDGAMLNHFGLKSKPNSSV